MKLKNLDDYLADKLSSFMSTMTLFWILLILDIFGAIFDPPSSLQGWLLWGVSILFQSVALPVLALVQNKQTNRIEKLLNDINTTTMNELNKQTELISLLQNEISLERDETTELHSILQDLAEIQHKLNIQEGEIK